VSPKAILVEYGTCPVCGLVTLPVLPLSPCGHDAAPDIAMLDLPGTVYSWTSTGSGVGTQIVMADFLDGTLRVTGPILSGPDVDIGTSVTLVVGHETPYGFVAVS
jgi:hypothetical protein